MFMALLQPTEEVQVGLEAARASKSGVMPALDVPNRAEIRLLVQELLAFNKARLEADPKLAEVVQSLEN